MLLLKIITNCVCFQSGSNFTLYGNTSNTSASEFDTTKLTNLIKDQTVYLIRKKNCS